jgi:hypothetical protein
VRSGISFEGLKKLIEAAVAKKPQGQHAAAELKSNGNKRPMSRIGG